MESISQGHMCNISGLLASTSPTRWCKERDRLWYPLPSLHVYIWVGTCLLLSSSKEFPFWETSALASQTSLPVQGTLHPVDRPHPSFEVHWTPVVQITRAKGALQGGGRNSLRTSGPWPRLALLTSWLRRSRMHTPTKTSTLLITNISHFGSSKPGLDFPCRVRIKKDVLYLINTTLTRYRY